ncbi:hypothetical protein HY374_02570 [Candidatus Berkelbacteria bacterium]|nr:hypothetical protein [Candidatus Berkelbacteria bacterium]
MVKGSRPERPARSTRETRRRRAAAQFQSIEMQLHSLFKSAILERPPLAEYLLSHEFVSFTEGDLGLIFGSHYFLDSTLGRPVMLPFHSREDIRITLPVLSPNEDGTFTPLTDRPGILELLEPFKKERDLGHAEFSDTFVTKKDRLSREEQSLGVAWCEDGEVSAFILEWRLHTLRRAARDVLDPSMWLRSEFGTVDSELRRELNDMGLTDPNGIGTSRFDRLWRWVRRIAPTDKRWLIVQGSEVSFWSQAFSGLSLAEVPSQDALLWIQGFAARSFALRERSPESIAAAARFNVEGHFQYRQRDYHIPKHVIQFPLLTPHRESAGVGFFVGTITHGEDETRVQIRNRIRATVLAMWTIAYPALAALLRDTASRAAEVAAWRRFVGGLNHQVGNALVGLTGLNGLPAELEGPCPPPAIEVAERIRVALAPMRFARSAVKDVEEAVKHTGVPEDIVIGALRRQLADAFVSLYWRRAGFADGVVYSSTRLVTEDNRTPHGRHPWFSATLASVLLELLKNAVDYDLIGDLQAPGIIWETHPALQDTRTALAELPEGLRRALEERRGAGQPLAFRVTCHTADRTGSARAMVLRRSLEPLFFDQKSGMGLIPESRTDAGFTLEVLVDIDARPFPSWRFQLDGNEVDSCQLPLLITAELHNPLDESLAFRIERVGLLRRGWQKDIAFAVTVTSPCTQRLLTTLRSSAEGPLSEGTLDHIFTEKLREYALGRHDIHLGLATAAFYLFQRQGETLSDQGVDIFGLINTGALNPSGQDEVTVGFLLTRVARG